MNSRHAVQLLLCATLGLPLLQVLLGWVSRLLKAMGDESAASVLDSCGAVIGVLWLASLTGLLVAVAFRSLQKGDGPTRDHRSDS